MTILLIVLAIVAGLVAAGAIYQALGVAADERRFPPPGRMVDIGEPSSKRGLHLLESGSGPAVIFEAGIAATGLNWTAVRSQVERFAHACAYDRAGLGWSDRAAPPRTTLAIVEDLHRLIEQAGIAAPYVLVGHSFGGLVVRAYSARYEAEVAGLVLVDPLSVHEWLEPDRAQARMLRLGVTLSRRGAMLARIGVVRAALALLMAGGRRVPKLVARASSGRGETVITRIVGEVQKMPPETWPMVRAHWSTPKSFLGMGDYLEGLPQSAREAAALDVPETIAITVISAFGSTPEQLEEREEMARRSARGRHIVAQKSGHWIQLDEPELVVEAVKEMLAK